MKLQKYYALILIGIFPFLSCGGDDGASDDQADPAIQFTSTPSLQSDHNRTFSYTFSAQSNEGLPLSYEVNIPSFMSYNEDTRTISGVPDWPRLNSDITFSITASDGTNSVTQRKSVQIVLGEILCNSDFGEPSESLYILPFESGESFELSQSNCPSNPNWGHHNWFALDFDMPIGTPLLASRAGTVIAVRENQRDGTRVCGEENYVFILHDDGSVASYVHLTQAGAEVNVDQRVEQGDLIGYSGDSGCSIGPHLHLAIFRQRGPYDRQYTLPINFSNATGPLNNANGLVQDGVYTAN